MRILGLLLALASQPLLAAPAYITDKLTTFVHSGAGPQFRIIKNLPSGQAVERVRDDKESGYSLIKFGSSQGWLPTIMLSDQAPAHTRLDEMQKKLEQFGKERDQAQGTQRNATSQMDALKTKNQEINQQLAEQSHQINQLEQENQSLKNQAGKEGLIYGGSLLLGGLLLSPLIARLWPKRRNRYSSW